MNWLCVTGVAQVLNRLDGKPFDDADQRLFEVKTKKTCSVLCKYESVWNYDIVSALFLGLCDLLRAGHQQHHHVRPGEEVVGQAVGGSGCKKQIKSSFQ